MTEKTLRTRLRRAGWRTTNHACVNLLLTAARTKNNLIRTCWTSGSGRFTKNHDHHEMTKRMCRALKLSYVEGNDSPRGGLTGQFVKLDSRSMKLLGGVRAETAKREQAIAERKEAALSHARQVIRGTSDADAASTLVAWYRAEQYHPAPQPVLDAKEALGLTWKVVKDLCRALA